MFYESWFGLLRVAVVGLLSYIAIVVCLRVSGKRTLSKWNAFDFIVTIALGSSLATVLISKDVVYVEGLVAFVLLIALQFLITWSSVRFRLMRHIVKSSPTILLRDGNVMRDVLVSQRVTESEVNAAIRSAGYGSHSDIEAVVLETDGTFSVIPTSKRGDASALRDLSQYSSEKE